MISMFPTMPPIATKEFMWLCLPETMQQTLFHFLTGGVKSAKTAEYLLCNSFHEIEPAVFDAAPHFLPIGPLLPASRPGLPVGRFWPEDPSCLAWLDKQDTCSVVYVSFGSFAMLEDRQFHELANDLELVGKPVLWVIRPDLLNNTAVVGDIQVRMAGKWKVVSWAPQQKVLAHPSVACFVSHCGWNSTMEGVVNGVPFLCWPYFSDQFFNSTCICDLWRIGLRLDKGEDGVVKGEEVSAKLEAVLGDEEMRARAMELKGAARRSIGDGGASKKNLDRFIDAMLHE